MGTLNEQSSMLVLDNAAPASFLLALVKHSYDPAVVNVIATDHHDGFVGTMTEPSLHL
jgi:hypothetical protein